MSTFTVAAIGVHVLDIHVTGIESIPAASDGALVPTIRMSPAGSAGGTALVLSRLGARVRSFGAVGDDLLAQSLVAALTYEGVDVAGLVRKPGQQTSASVIPVRPNGDRPAWHCVGANASWTLDDLRDDALVGIDHLHLGGPEFMGGPMAARVLSRAKDAGITTSVDILAPGDPGILDWIRDALPYTDYLMPNDEQVLGLTGAASLREGAQDLVAAGAGCVAVTSGSKGALVVTADKVIEVPAYKIDVVDTTGCGDAFSAGFLVGRSRGWSAAESARLGCAAAAQVAQGLGSDASVYDFASVETFAKTAAILAAGV